MGKIDRLRFKLRGHLKIYSYESQEDLEAGKNFILLLDDHNAIDPENAAILFARGLTHRSDSTIYYMAFGTGGATIDPLGNVILNPPLTTGNADLYDPVYSEIVDNGFGAAPAGNSETYMHVAGTQISTVVVSCTIQKNEPFNQDQTPFTFNEIGLKTQDGLLITHVTFTPITKGPTRLIQIVYTIEITLDITASPGQVVLIGLEVTAGVGSFTNTQVSHRMTGVQAGSQTGSLVGEHPILLVGVQSESESGTMTVNVTP